MNFQKQIIDYENKGEETAKEKSHIIYVWLCSSWIKEQKIYLKTRGNWTLIINKYNTIE